MTEQSVALTGKTACFCRGGVAKDIEHCVPQCKHRKSFSSHSMLERYDFALCTAVADKTLPVAKLIQTTEHNSPMSLDRKFYLDTFDHGLLSHFYPSIFDKMLI